MRCSIRMHAQLLLVDGCWICEITVFLSRKQPKFIEAVETALLAFILQIEDRTIQDG